MPVVVPVVVCVWCSKRFTVSQFGRSEDLFVKSTGISPFGFISIFTVFVFYRFFF